MGLLDALCTNGGGRYSNVYASLAWRSNDANQYDRYRGMQAQLYCILSEQRNIRKHNIEKQRPHESRTRLESEEARAAAGKPSNDTLVSQELKFEKENVELRTTNSRLGAED